MFAPVLVLTGINAGFGVIDLYLAFAGMRSFFPAGPFGLRPADHVVHVVIGALIAFGIHASRRVPT